MEHPPVDAPRSGVVLVVDDDDDLRLMIKALLEADGFDVKVVANAGDAVLYLDEHEPPCSVLVDLLMPGIIGTSLLDYVRNERRLAGVPVAVVSASPQLAPPGYPVFGKPIDPRALLAFIRQGCRPRDATLTHAAT